MADNIAIIPARGGSKAIPKKNIVNLCGKPLIAYSIHVAKKSPSIDRVVVDTDSEEIAELAEHYGAEILYIRPKHLARDLTPDLPVFKHACRFLLRSGLELNMIIHLRPTSPYRTVKLLEQAIALFNSDKKITNVKSVVIAEQTPYKMWCIKRSGFLDPLMKAKSYQWFNLPRQKLPIVYWQTGNIDIIKPSVIMKQNSMTGQYIKPFIMKDIFAIDIDTPLSLKVAEVMLRPYLKKA